MSTFEEKLDYDCTYVKDKIEKMLPQAAKNIKILTPSIMDDELIRFAKFVWATFTLSNKIFLISITDCSHDDPTIQTTTELSSRLDSADYFQK